MIGNSDIYKSSQFCALVENCDRFYHLKNISEKLNLNVEIYLHTSLAGFRLARKVLPSAQHYLLTGRAGVKNFDSYSIDEVVFNYIGSKEIDSKSENLLKEISLSGMNILIFNGYSYTAKSVLKYFSSEKKIFSEISNFPGKYQVSPYGVNASSGFDIEVKKRRASLKDDELKVMLQNCRAIRSELESYIPVHANRKILPRIYEAFFNYFLNRSSFGLNPPALVQCQRLISTIRSRRLLKTLKDRPIIYSKYALFIGQVEYDSQTVFQSSETGLSALKKAITIAKEKKLPLVYRPHPAEKCFETQKKILDFAKMSGVYCSLSGSLVQSLQDCELLITINSTSGMQARLFGIPVITLGDCVYGGWDEVDVSLYYDMLD